MAMTRYRNWRMRIVMDVLESAKDVEHEGMIAACRRLIEANRRGWRSHHDPKDWEVVREMWEELADCRPTEEGRNAQRP
jgi:hypothetical protein